MPVSKTKTAASKTTGKTPLIQPRFDVRIATLAFPLSGGVSGPIERGFLIWDQVLPGYKPGSQRHAAVHYLYNPSTVASYMIADPTAQAALNFPNPGDTAQLAIPLSQTVEWSIMFDRTYELNTDAFDAHGNVKNPGKYAQNDPRTIGVQADVLQMLQFIGVLTTYSYGTAQAAGLLQGLTAENANQNLSTSSGIMQLVPCYAYFGNAGLKNNVAYYGYITELDIQFTHWTQYNVPERCVIDINMTLLPPPAKNTSLVATPGTAAASQNYFSPPPQTRVNRFGGNGTGGSAAPAAQPAGAPQTLTNPFQTGGISGR